MGMQCRNTQMAGPGRGLAQSCHPAETGERSGTLIMVMEQMSQIPGGRRSTIAAEIGFDMPILYIFRAIGPKMPG